MVNSILRRVPARIEGENFGREGRDVSYGVKEPGKRSEFYRIEEPVPVNARESARRRADQFITLNADEWTACTIDSGASTNCVITIKARVKNAPAEAQLVVGERTLEVKLTPGTWLEIKLGSVPLARGANRLKWIIRQGTVDLDWLDVAEGGKQTRPAVPLAKSDGG